MVSALVTIESMRTAIERARAEGGEPYAVGRWHGSMELGFYAPAGSDPQQPHTQDELYFVASGSGRFVCGDEAVEFGPGDALFVAAGVTHRFEEFTDDFAAWVVFYGPDGGEQPRDI